jgi:S-adenosylmethionine decarboxylase proenzyme
MHLEKDRKKFNHFIIELFNVNKANFDEIRLNKKIKKLVESFDIKIIKNSSHKFTPIGLTSAFILSTSHLVVHTWPEHSYLHLDFFCCASLIDKTKLNRITKEIFPKTEISTMEVKYDNLRL